MKNILSEKGGGFTRLYETVIAIISFVAIVFQAYLTTGSFGNLFSYFTILTNLLIAVSLTIIVVFPNSYLGKFFKRTSVQTAVALYIFIVALVYNTVLRGLLTLNGWDYFVDTLLHVIVPVLYIIYWFTSVNKGTLLYKQVFWWLIFPFCYLLYSLVRGSFFSWYPYPFLNVLEFGYSKVFINSTMLIIVFVLSGIALIAPDKWLAKINNTL